MSLSPQRYRSKPMKVRYLSCQHSNAKSTAVSRFLSSFGTSLESALNESSSYRGQRLFNLQLVSARDIYGFHPEDHVFIKIILYNPQDVAKAAEILQVRMRSVRDRWGQTWMWISGRRSERNEVPALRKTSALSSSIYSEALRFVESTEVCSAVD